MTITYNKERNGAKAYASTYQPNKLADKTQIHLTHLMHAKFLSYRKFTKSNLSAERTGQVLSYSNITCGYACRGCYHSDTAIATERQRSDLFAIWARSYSYTPSGSLTELIVLARCTDWISLFVPTCIGILVCWFRAILRRRIISQSTRIVAYEWMQESAMYLTTSLRMVRRSFQGLGRHKVKS